ncbi:rhodanese-like domain-containing protein [Candidatus Cetobacterium colombiensis]|uniref:Rhodanese-like domain-containing protein n=1 Tax=Candidatus Cetobacterium colombiensis TaxID=3073100 RepID=A0ABU4W911_9FUSO|nr:rhodanese-like domain-containing protein [Candidatus Cetobacterium colombiensis]MDX8336002.1 rhodanese-like domain-containing protein [Candidatus Cetobacterium colombiensis]
MKNFFLSTLSILLAVPTFADTTPVKSESLKDKAMKAAYSTFNNVEGDYETIPLSEVKNILTENKAKLLDVRNDDEIKETGIIKGAKHIPLPELENRLNELDKDQPYITFCAVGGRSKKAAAILSKNGFKKVYNAKEGMNTWPYKEMVEPVK